MYHIPPSYSGYPRLFFSADDLRALQRKLEHHDCAATWRKFLHACEEALKPDASPPHLFHLRASQMAFAWIVTGRQEFADKARQLTLKIVQRPYWSDADPQTNPFYRAGLSTGGCLSEVCLAYDWLYPLWSQDEKKLIQDAVRRKAFEPALADIRDKRAHTEWFTCNGMNVLHGPVLMAAILFENDFDTSEAYRASLSQIQHAIAAHCCDGGYPEGPGYWNYGIRFMLFGVEPLRRLKGIDLYHEPFLHNNGDYPLHYILPWLTHTHNPSDSGCLAHKWAPIAALAAYHKRPEWQWIARRLMTHDFGDDGESIEYSMMNLIFYDPDIPSAPPAPSQAVHLFSGLQNLSMRSDWSEDAIAALWLSGATNFHHNHLHLNSFTIAAYRKRLLIEMGQYDYADGNDPRKATEGHNSLLADGEGQIITTDEDIFCRRVRAGQWGTVYGEFQSLREEAGALIATGVTVNAYRGRLRNFDRTLAFVNRRFFFLHDFVELAKTPPLALEWRFHSGGAIELTEDGADLVNGDARLAIIFLDAHAIARSVRLKPNELCIPGKPVPCLDLKAICATPTFELAALLIPYQGRKPALRLERSDRHIAFSFERQTWRYEPARRKLFANV